MHVAKIRKMQFAAQGFAAKNPALVLRLRHSAPVATNGFFLVYDVRSGGDAALSCAACIALSWASGRESTKAARARMRFPVKRILRKYDYPPAARHRRSGCLAAGGSVVSKLVEVTDDTSLDCVTVSPVILRSVGCLRTSFRLRVLVFWLRTC